MKVHMTAISENSGSDPALDYKQKRPYPNSIVNCSPFTLNLHCQQTFIYMYNYVKCGCQSHR